MDLEDTLLMMPGPVPVAPRVLRAMSKPMINHRSAEFAGIYTDCRGILADIFQTKKMTFYSAAPELREWKLQSGL